MNKTVFQGRRGIVPLQHKIVTVPEYWLSMDFAGIPYLEPCYASLIKRTEKEITEEYAMEIHSRCKAGTPFKWDSKNPENSLPPTLQGVVYQITKACLDRIIRTEGGWGYDNIPVGYDVIEVDCKTSEDEIIVAKTLIARPASVRSGCHASARYLNLLREGAKEFNFRREYQNYLNSLVAFDVNTTRKKIGRSIFLTLFMPHFTLIFAILRLSLKHNRRIPLSVAWLVIYVCRLSYIIHDRIWKYLFGSGWNNE
ncbi:9055_t:CDS:2 [Paraglomus occultum]|uniref:gamma-glutamylcyclotransferase n=1 Tax=Paraglomus occultum TaxID=144539 RepID=A0A9N9A062_9GLOM|nr:9055_t:CDS:2 [Paraglomus occultum]